MGEMITFEPKPAELAYTFGGVGPVAQLRPGDVLTVFTEDCFGGAVRWVEDLPSQVCRMPYLNPVSGPFLVEDAEPGDTLAVHFLDIAPAREWGMSSTFPHFGALTSTHTTAMLQPCDVHGGNLDSPEVSAGATLYLPVFVHGALLALGDGHARQGQGEASGVAVETAMWTTLTVDLIKGVVTPTPRLETDEALLSIGCARPLEDAYRISQADLVRWVAELTGLDLLDALQLVAQAGAAPVGNVCDPNYTMLAQISKAYLRGAVAYGGVHERLRATPRPTAPGTGRR
jgi:acetamidase/formamidase